jgi:hypothetical protein
MLPAPSIANPVIHRAFRPVKGEGAARAGEPSARLRASSTRYGERPARALNISRAGSSHRFALLGGAASMLDVARDLIEREFEIARVMRIVRVNRHAETEE